MYRFAYYLPGVNMMAADSHPQMARIRRGWVGGIHIQADHRGGVLAVWPKGDGSPVSLDMFGVPRETTDGVVYYPSLELPTRDELIRDGRGQGVWVSLAVGGEVWVPLALAAPRKLIMRMGQAMEHGDYATEFGILGHELYRDFFDTASEGVKERDPRLARLLFLAEQQSYARTEEMAEDDPWLTTSDLAPVIRAIMGLDPKASTADPAGSASADPVTETLN